MNRTILILAFFSSFFISNAQEFEGTIKFENKIIYKNKKDSIKNENKNQLFVEKIGLSPSEHLAYNAEVFLKKDSCLVVKYYFQSDTPDFYIQNTPSNSLYTNLKTGKEVKYSYHFKRTFPSFDSKKKVKAILGYECTLYKAENENAISEIWVANKLDVNPSQKAFSHFMYNGKIILEQTYFAKNQRLTYQTKATEINVQKVNKIFARYDEYNKIDDTEKMYSLLNENADFNIPPIKVGDKLPELYYRDVKSLTIKSINQFKANGKFLMFEFWGTWCKPCLNVSPKIKAFYSNNKDKIDLLSFNCKDKTYKRVLELIDKKQMDWNHAFGTNKLIEILNPTRKYPTMVLLDDNLKVLLIGNPGTKLDDAAKLIN